jgi:hypothetical protein
VNGKVGAEGEMITVHEEVFNIDVAYFNGGVTFTQRVTVKGNAKTNLSGSIQYMLCNNKQCLPPVTKGFSVTLK